MGFLSGFFSNDILGLYREPTAYKMADGRIATFTYFLPETKERMKCLGYLEKYGLRILLYQYPGTLEELAEEAQANPHLRLMED
jgi:hypothetical protein